MIFLRGSFQIAKSLVLVLKFDLVSQIYMLEAKVLLLQTGL